MSRDWTDDPQTLSRLQRFLSPTGGSGESALESTASIQGLPNERDVQRIASRLAVAGGAAWSGRDDEAESVAREIVLRARRSLEKLDGAPLGRLMPEEAVALEAVVHVRGRPAARVLGHKLEDLRLFPASDLWLALFGEHRRTVMQATGASAAVRVRDALLPQRSWTQGTAVLIGETLALTNRHVLLPRNGATRLVRRRPGTDEARMKGGYAIELDFAFDNGPAREIRYRVTGVPFIAADDDPVDAALLTVEPVSKEDAPAPLAVSRGDVFDIDRLYVIGHPGRMNHVPDDVQTVFGDPDERKRVSFGMLMDPVVDGQAHVVHDASTIGGFSGGGVHGFLTTDVMALHYWGDGIHGNRAIAARALRDHDALGPRLASV